MHIIAFLFFDPFWTPFFRLFCRISLCFFRSIFHCPQDWILCGQLRCIFHSYSRSISKRASIFRCVLSILSHIFRNLLYGSGFHLCVCVFCVFIWCMVMTGGDDRYGLHFVYEGFNLRIDGISPKQTLSSFEAVIVERCEEFYVFFLYPMESQKPCLLMRCLILLKFQ